MSIKRINVKNITNSACVQFMLGLFFMAGTIQSCSVFKDHEHKPAGVENTMTVAIIRPAVEGQQFVEVSFLRSQRFYKLPKDADPAFLRLLKESEQHHSPLVISRASEESDVITGVAHAGKSDK